MVTAEFALRNQYRQTGEEPRGTPLSPRRRPYSFLGPQNAVFGQETRRPSTFRHFRDFPRPPVPTTTANATATTTTTTVTTVAASEQPIHPLTPLDHHSCYRRARKVAEMVKSRRAPCLLAKNGVLGMEKHVFDQAGVWRGSLGFFSGLSVLIS